MVRGKRVGVYLSGLFLVFILGMLGWFLSTVFEGEIPSVELSSMPDFISGPLELTITASDNLRGIKRVKAILLQEGREHVVLEKHYPFKGILNREGIHKIEENFALDPSKLALSQSRVVLEVTVWDYSRRSGGDGNVAAIRHQASVDTVPPFVRAVSRLHYVNQGGTGFVVYQSSSDTVESGVLVEDMFFPGFPLTVAAKEGISCCYFPIPFNIHPESDILLWAKDKAGNESRSNFHCLVRRKEFAADKITLTDGFLDRILPYFKEFISDDSASRIKKFLEINREIRTKNDLTFKSLKTNTSPRKLWEGSWVRLPNSATMAKFGDRRSYYYQGEKIDEQVHLGIDLASLANSQIPAANSGRVICAENLGIYGLTIILDHGQGIASVYSHLSEIKVGLGQEVKKGQFIGISGQTGLAGGDHLHFAVMAHGFPVNPIEWWDPHWINENIEKRLNVVN
ncbi:MAG: M23 family metallopeptidase [Desulfobacteraceae bacterium]|nr:MAG: M23 family metallopeptidase [Desulfobacteraceae bacterium]